MFGITRFWHSTIGKKIVMALTGIIGILFVLGHMTGNLLMFKGQGAMHDYATLLRTSLPLLWGIRLALIAAVVLHAVAAYQLTMLSRAARPDGYTVRKPQVTTFAARTIRWGGVLLLVFIVFHILHFTTGTLHPDFTHLDPYNNVRIGLSNPLVAAFYVLAMAALGLHLFHGSWAVVRTIGIARPSTQPLKRRVALFLAILVTAGFMLIPIGALLGAFQPTAALDEVPVAASAVTPSSETN